MSTHELKVVPPYFDALVSGSKTFEVRKNDRAYQKGDVLKLREWHPAVATSLCEHPGCGCRAYVPHWARPTEYVERIVSFVYAGDPRFGGVEPGFVVLGLGPVGSSQGTGDPEK